MYPLLVCTPIKQVMMLKKILWIMFILILHVSGKLSVTKPQIICDHGLPEYNKELSNKTDTLTDIQNWQVKCLTNHCNTSTYLEFIIKKHNRFCISWKTTGQGHEQQYVMEYELQRLDSIWSPPFYIPVFQSVHDMDTTVMTLHCQYQQQETQAISLRLHPCNCTEKSQQNVPTNCPQSTVSPVISKKTTDYTLITETRDNATDSLTKNVAIVVSLTIIFCFLVVILVYQAKKCRKVYPINNRTGSTNNESHVTSYSTANNINCETLNDSNCECTPHNRTSSYIDLNNYNHKSYTECDSVMEQTESGHRQSKTLHTSYSTGQFTNSLPEYIQQQLIDLNKSSDSSDSELEA